MLSISRHAYACHLFHEMVFIWLVFLRIHKIAFRFSMRLWKPLTMTVTSVWLLNPFNIVHFCYVYGIFRPFGSSSTLIIITPTKVSIINFRTFVIRAHFSVNMVCEEHGCMWSETLLNIDVAIQRFFITTFTP